MYSGHSCSLPALDIVVWTMLTFRQRSLSDGSGSAIAKGLPQKQLEWTKGFQDLQKKKGHSQACVGNARC